MNPEEFYNKANEKMHDLQNESISTDNLNVFGDDDFDFDDDSDFSDSNEIKETFSDDDDDDFDFDLDDFSDTEDSVAKLTSGFTIESITIIPNTTNRHSTLVDEVKEFFETHLVREVDKRKLFECWNELYNDDLTNDTECLMKYLQVTHGLWFENHETFVAAVDKGVDFLNALQFHHRLCKKSDLIFISEVFSKSWYKPEVIDKYSLDTQFDQILIELMRNHFDNYEILEHYTDKPDVLLSCIRLLVDDKFIRSEFENAVSEGNLSNYVSLQLDNQSSRFDCLKNRSDYSERVAQILDLEAEGALIDQSVINEFANAYYLDVIINACASNTFNPEFARAWLMDDLNEFDFVAKVYDKGEVDLSLGGENLNFFLAKFRTDCRKYLLPVRDTIVDEFFDAVQLIVMSFCCGLLPEIDYKKFLAVLSYSKNLLVIKDIAKTKTPLKSFNYFMARDLVTRFGRDDLVIPENIGSAIAIKAVLREGASVKSRTIVSLDWYPLDPAGFSDLVKNVDNVKVLPGNAGLFLSEGDFDIRNQDSAGEEFDNKFYYYDSRDSSNVVWCRTDVRSSLDTWASSEIPVEVLQTYSNYCPVFYANLIKMIEDAKMKLEEDLNKASEDEDKSMYQVNNGVYDLFKLSGKNLMRFDAVFNMITDAAYFIYLLRLDSAVWYIKNLVPSCIYANSSVVMFSLLYAIFKTAYNSKFVVENSRLCELSTRTTLFFGVRGYDKVLYSFKVFISSLNAVTELADRSSRVVLTVENGVIMLKV